MGLHRPTRRAAAFPHRLEGACPAGVPATVGTRECRDWWAWLREQVNRMPVQLGPLLQASGSDVDRMWTGANGKDEAPKPSGLSEADSGLSVRAIQDSNLWPLAPEANALSS